MRGAWRARLLKHLGDVVTVDRPGPPEGMTIKILYERASPRPKTGQPGALPWAGHAVSFEELHKGLTTVDRQGSAAVPTEDSAAQNRHLGEAVTLGTGNRGTHRQCEQKDG